MYIYIYEFYLLIYINKSLGRFDDQANRFHGLLYHSTVGIFGQIRTQPAWGWLTWRGEKLSRNQQIKYATSLDAGNILRAIGTIRGQLKQQSTVEGRNKLDRLTSELVKRCVLPAQKYIAKKLGDLSWNANKPVILKFIILQAINSRITEGNAGFEVRSARESWRPDAQGHFDWSQPIETTIDPVGFNFFQLGRAGR